MLTDQDQEIVHTIIGHVLLNHLEPIRDTLAIQRELNNQLLERITTIEKKLEQHENNSISKT